MPFTDYEQSTGTSGTMLVRVADSAGVPGVISANHAQFYIKCDDPATYVGSPGFVTSARVDNVWYGLNNLSNYSNAEGYRYLGEILVSSDQTIIFHINASGTMGFGGPTDFAVTISRAATPPAPTPLGIDNVGHQYFRYRFSTTEDGGSPILEMQIAYGYNQTYVEQTTSSSGTSTIGPFLIGTTVYVWCRARNSVGWGPYSTRLSVSLKKGLWVKRNNIWVQAIPYVKTGGAWIASEPYVKRDVIPGVSDGEWRLTQ